MRHLPIAAALLAALACPAYADDAALLQEARQVAGSMPPKLLNKLQEQIQTAGAEGAIPVCKDMAPQMAKELGTQTGWSIRRVSLKNRNPKAVPDAWERAVLEEFEKRTANGEKPTGLEKSEVVADGDKKIYRYMKALPTQDLCLQCHGTDDRISPAVRDVLKKHYPDDKAVGYGPAEIRGAITIKKAL